ncbi:P44-42 outer membrane protein, partial [Anaplasma phagocytophilum str. HGE1]
RKGIIREYEVDTVYILAKELAYDVVTGQTDNLAAALAKTSGKDIVQFAKAVEISHSDIDGKICRTKSGQNQNNYAKYAAESDVVNSRDKFNVALCGGTGPAGSSSNNSTEQQVLRDFVRETLKDGSKNWPTSTGTAPKPEQNDNAKAVAKDLTKLTTEEKTIVAGLLAKTIEGGEVVEIRAVSSTSVVVNAEFEIIRLCSIEG